MAVSKTELSAISFLELAHEFRFFGLVRLVQTAVELELALRCAQSSNGGRDLVAVREIVRRVFQSA
jgi:hypothetical protein